MHEASCLSVYQDPVTEIRRLAEFLGVDPSVADTVAEKTKFSAMQEFKTQNDMPEIAQFFDNNKANANIFRKGKGCILDSMSMLPRAVTVTSYKPTGLKSLGKCFFQQRH